MPETETKSVWIAGASSGIGAELARRLDRAGHRVAVSARRADRLDELTRTGRNMLPLPLDVTDATAVSNAVGDVIEAFGRLDLAILNAGTYRRGSFEDTALADFEAAMTVNYFGVVHGLKALLPVMRDPGGQIAVVASLAGYCGLPYANGYGPSKAAVISLCESLRAELAGSRIDLRLINPGFVDTPLTRQNDFEMPYLMATDAAAKEILRQLEGGDFEIAFPAPFVRRLKLLRLMPYRWYFAAMRRVTA